MSARSPRVTLAAILAIALVLRAGAAALPIASEAPDTRGYAAPAWSLARGLGYLDDDGRPTFDRPPGYPALLAVCYALAGSPSDVAARMAQALLGTATVLLVHDLVRRRRDETTAHVAAAILAVDPIALGTVPLVLRENQLAFLVTLVLWTLAALPDGARGRLLIGVELGVLVLTHSLYGLLGPYLAAADLAPATARPRLPRTARWALAAAPVLLAIGLWSWRCQRAGFTTLTLTSYPVPAAELWLSSACTNHWLPSDEATGLQALHYAEIVRLIGERGHDGAKAELYRRFFVNVRDEPLTTLARFARLNLWYWLEVPGAVRLTSGRLWPLRAFAIMPFHWARLAAVVAGVLALRRERALPALRFELAALAFFATAPALLCPIPRFLAPAAPLLDVFAAIGLVASRRREVAP